MNKTRRLLYVAALFAILITWYFSKKYHASAVRPIAEKVLHTAVNAKIQSLEPTFGVNYNNPTYDTLYEQAANMPDSPARTKMYEQLNQFIAEQVPIIYSMHLDNIVLYHGWLKNYLLSDCIHGTEQYLDIDTSQKSKILEQINQEGKR